MCLWKDDPRCHLKVERKRWVMAPKVRAVAVGTEWRGTWVEGPVEFGD